LVGLHGGAVLERHGRSVHAYERRPAPGAVGEMACDTRQLREQLLALLLQRAAGVQAAAPAQPRLIIGRLHHVDRAYHPRVPGSAVFRTEQVVFPHLRGLEPDRAVTAWDGVCLDAKRGNEQVVQRVFGREDDADRTTHWHVQLVDLALAVYVLEAPHPTLAGRI